MRDGLIQSNDAFTDTMTLPRQIGMMPPLGSPAEQRLTGAFNAKTRVTSGLAASEAELVAEGVWIVQGQPGRCNVYLIEDDGGVTLFDAGARTMTRAVASAGAKLGGIRRVVLGHGHTDHRGVAPALGVPVLCHPDEVQDAEGSGGFRYWPARPRGPADAPAPDPPPDAPLRVGRRAGEDLRARSTEGDEVAGFRVVHLPGHAPGLIGLWRESDRLALSSDCFYTLDMWGRDCAPRVPEAVYNFDTEQARASIRKLAALEPAAAWPGHARPVTGDVRAQLERAADASPEREQARAAGAESARRRPSSDYTDPHGNVLTLRGSLTPATRREYARDAGRQGRRALAAEDAWQRAVELLFERLAVRWVIAGAPIDRQRELLLRFRVATPRSARGCGRRCASTAPSTSPTCDAP